MSYLTKVKRLPLKHLPNVRYSEVLGPVPETEWYRYNKPGPYPKTEEEKIAAAKRYGLLREEYEPYPDDGTGIGDYPNLKHEQSLSKSPFYQWTDQFHRRHVFEPIPRYFAFYIPGRIYEERAPFKFWQVLTGICLIIFGTGTIVTLLNSFKMTHKTLEKQYGKPGVIHYTFDFEDEESSSGKHH